MIGSDFLVVGGGVAGLSIAWHLAKHGKVVVLEREAATAYHASGRSATYFHFGIGDRTVRLLTRESRSFLADPPAGFADVPLLHPAPALMVARAGQDELFERNLAQMASITGTSHEIDQAEIRRRVPVLKLGGDGIARGLIDPVAARIDGHALMTGFARGQTALGGRIETRAEVLGIASRAGHWEVATRDDTYRAPVLVNAAGAWADVVARMAGVAPLGLVPMRRTIIAFDPPAGVDVTGWPLVRALAGEFYFLPETGRLLASPADETPSEPCDAQPDEYDVALAAWRIEEFTTMKVARVLNKWAGLRTFTADRVPVAGFAPGAPGFFWLAGQGGYGLQTSPAMATIAAAAITGTSLPDGYPIDPRDVSPTRDHLGGCPSP